MWLCQCACGNQAVLRSDMLRRGGSTKCKSCSSRAINTKTGVSTHPLGRRWGAMMQRCYNPANPSYPNYGGRGIRVCERWHDARHYFADIEQLLGPCPPGFSLDRIDNHGDYGPGNVRWADLSTQMKNRRPCPPRQRNRKGQFA